MPGSGDDPHLRVYDRDGSSVGTEPPEDIPGVGDGSGGNGVSDHGDLTGLSDDDHPQYVKDGDDFDGQGQSQFSNLQSMGAQSISLTDQRIYIYSAGDLLSTIDPTTTTTPIQDAWDTADDGSTIYYPPIKMQTAGGLSGGGQTRHIGLGGAGRQSGTVIEDTDETTPLFVGDTQADEEDAFFQGIRFESQTTPRSAPAFKFNANVSRWNLYDVWFDRFSGDDLFDFTNGHVWSSTWRSIRSRLYDSFIYAEDSGAPLILDDVYLNSDDESSPEIDYTGSNGDLIISAWNKGGVQCPLVDASKGSENSVRYIGPGNFEPSSAPTTIPYIVRVGFDAESFVAPFAVHEGALSVDYGVSIRANGSDGSTFAARNEYGLEIFGGGDGSHVYGGPASEVNNTEGTNLNNPIVCLADVTKKVSTGTGYDGGTDDSQL
jgi:hypothetical protein